MKIDAFDFKKTAGAIRDAVAVARGAARLLRPHRREADAKASLQQLLDRDEGMRRLTSEHARFQRDFLDALTRERMRAAGVARFRLDAAAAQIKTASTEIETRRRQTWRTFDAVGYTAADAMQTAIFIELRRPIISAMSPGELLAAHRAGLNRRDAVGCAECELIETMLRSGNVHASAPDQIKALKDLREHIDDIETLRLPSDLPDLDQLERDCRRVFARLDLLKVLPAPETDTRAGEEFERLEEALRAAGAADDAEDQKAAQQELAGVGGE